MKKYAVLLYIACSAYSGITKSEDINFSDQTRSLITGVGTGNPYLTTVNTTQFKNSGESSLLKTYSITTPGLYTFISDVGSEINSTDTSTIGGATALYINSNNVVIDLNGRSLYYAGSAAGTSGIEIGINKHNITIKNGNITGFTLSGLLSNYGCSDIKLENVTISNCKGPSLYFKGTDTSGQDISGSLIKNCNIVKTTGVTDTTSVGLQVDYGYNILIENTHISDVDVTGTAAAIGVYLNTCTAIQMIDCSVSSVNGTSAIGYSLANSVGSRFERCNASFCYSTVDVAAGFLLVKTTGTSAGHVLESCNSSSHSGQTNGYGFHQGGTQASQYSNCSASYCQERAGTETSSAGFYSADGTGNVWTNCQSIGNLTIDDADHYVAGFELAGEEKQSTFYQCTARGNGSTATSGTAYGFFLKHATDIDYISVSACQAIANCSSSSGDAYGFFDNSTSSTNMFVDNFAFGNTNTTATDNFNVTLGSGIFPESEADIGGINAISGKPIYYNVSITS